MNHGLVCFEGDEIGSRLWQTAMGRGEFPALYTRGGPSEDPSVYGRAWRESFVPRPDGPLAFGGYEYARYEPEYDQPFLAMCLRVYNMFESIAVPAAAGDDEALAVLAAYNAVSPDVHRRFFGDRKDRRKPAERRLRPLIEPIDVPVGWAYLLGFFYPRPVTVFLSPDPEVVRTFEAADPDRYYFRVVERW